MKGPFGPCCTRPCSSSWPIHPVPPHIFTSFHVTVSWRFVTRSHIHIQINIHQCICMHISKWIHNIFTACSMHCSITINWKLDCLLCSLINTPNTPSQYMSYCSSALLLFSSSAPLLDWSVTDQSAILISASVAHLSCGSHMYYAFPQEWWTLVQFDTAGLFTGKKWLHSTSRLTIQLCQICPGLNVCYSNGSASCMSQPQLR